VASYPGLQLGGSSCVVFMMGAIVVKEEIHVLLNTKKFPLVKIMLAEMV
jgi:hypothetical protein